MQTDTISREAAMRAFTDEPQDKYTLGQIVAALDALPAVDAVEVVHAHWEDGNKSIRNPTGYTFNWWCSHCGKPQYTPVAKNLEEFTKDNPRCHWCGARMDGRRGEEHNAAD